MTMKTTLRALLLSLASATTFSQTWTPTSAPITNWSCVASSTDGSKLVAAVTNGFIYTSTNSGLTWTQTSAPSTVWTSLASSADGTKLFAGSYLFYLLPIYCSSDSGATWEPTGPDGGVYCVACSADGSKVAAAWWQEVGISTNSGVTWATLGPGPYPTFETIGLVSISADGNTLAVVTTTGFEFQPPSQLLTTPSSAWAPDYVPNVPPFGYVLYTSVAMSADGTKIVAAVNNFGYWQDPPSTNWGGMLYCSSNSGANAVTNYTTVTNWTSVASSADGTRLVAVASGGAIYTSTDAGANWEPASVTNANWAGVASSADGAKLVAVANGGGIYTWQTTPAPTLNITPSGDGLLVSWVVPSMNFRLQENSDLTTTNWTDLAIAPVLNFTNLQNQVTLPLGTANRFYRLQASAN